MSDTLERLRKMAPTRVRDSGEFAYVRLDLLSVAADELEELQSRLDSERENSATAGRHYDTAWAHLTKAVEALYRIANLEGGRSIALEALRDLPNCGVYNDTVVEKPVSNSEPQQYCPGCGKKWFVGQLHNCTGELHGRAGREV